MSDTTRQSLTERAKAAITPQAFKDDSQIAQEELRGKADKAQAYAQPSSERSYTQTAADAVRDATEGSDTTGMRAKAHDTWQSATDNTHTGGATTHSTHSSTSTDSNQEGLLEKIGNAFSGRK
ncbi:hypothetical protein GGF31_002705 [Allomyces arbusculus]|nr:hypothetical protein GGF31_002705 [Allomyces arbusculus]